MHTDYRPGLQCPRKSRMDWDHQLVGGALSGFVLHDTDSAADDVGSGHSADIAAALPRVQEQSEGEALSRTERPSLLEGINLLIGPGVESAEAVACQPGKWIVLSNVDRHGIGHNLRKGGPSQVGHARTGGADLFNDMTRGRFGKVPNEPVAMCRQYGLQCGSVGSLRRRRKICKIGRAKEARDDMGEGAGNHVPRGGRRWGCHGKSGLICRHELYRTRKPRKLHRPGTGPAEVSSNLTMPVEV